VSTPQHFRRLADLPDGALRALLERSRALRAMQRARAPQPLFGGRVIALLFEKASTRTRVSFEAAMAHGGGHAMFLSPRDLQLGRGETLEDSARVLSRMVDAIVIRTHEHARIETFAAAASVPVINALTDEAHPCQLLADLLTWTDAHGELAGRRAAFVGDGNNVCRSWMEAAGLLGFELAVASPPGYEPPPPAGASVRVGNDPAAAVAGADVVITDVWASMGQEDEAQARARAFAGFQVDGALMGLAAPGAIFLHCLPAHRGEEVAAEVIDGPQSRVWDEAENRLHTQKALLELLLK
jgi:ornithine carbamoyltransferase